MPQFVLWITSVVIYTRKPKPTQESRGHINPTASTFSRCHSSFSPLSIIKEDLEHLHIIYPQPFQLKPLPPPVQPNRKESITKVEPVKFLSEFLPGLWKHRPVQIFVTILTYAAISKRMTRGVRALQGKAGAEALTLGGVSRKSSHMR